ncbi:MAG TPA: PKD domain-containing protein, partial [Thermoplasmatales archaeon]|nr:PKD domain-containing protein [Thermoplasmatales archaeon]
AAGTYTVNLTVTDNGVPVLSDTTSTTVNVTEKPAAKKPPVAKTTGPYHGLTNQNITFDGSASYDGDGSIVNYTWDFGDGSVGYGVKPTHVYMVAGTFDVLLTVKDNDGLTNTTKTTATIELDSDGDGWSDEEEQRYGFDPNNSSSMPEDTDDDHVPDIVDSDDDNDGLPDDVETLVGSDPQNETNATNVTVADSNNYLVDTDNDGVYDTFYNPDTDTKTTVAKDQRGRYLIDFDGDGTVDYVYDPASGSVNSYGEVTPGAEIPWLLVAVVVIFAVIAITVVLYFRKKI